MGLGSTLFRTVIAGNVWIYRRSGGRIGSQNRKLILLTTTGRKTGLKRTTPLLAVPNGENLLVAASAGGSDTNPGWYHNLMANPAVEVERGRTKYSMTARVAGPDERPELWSFFVERAPQFARYESRTRREIPVVELERAD